MLQSRLLLEQQAQQVISCHRMKDRLEGLVGDKMQTGQEEGTQNSGKGGIPTRKSDLPNRLHTPPLILTKCTSSYLQERQMGWIYLQDRSSIKWDLLTYNSQSSQMQGKWLRAESHWWRIYWSGRKTISGCKPIYFPICESEMSWVR